MAEDGGNLNSLVPGGAGEFSDGDKQSDVCQRSAINVIDRNY
jgi:hypothetical protein